MTTISGSCVAIFPSEVNRFPKHLPSGSSFLITAVTIHFLEIIISNRKSTWYIVSSVDISRSDYHPPNSSENELCLRLWNALMNDWCWRKNESKETFIMTRQAAGRLRFQPTQVKWGNGKSDQSSAAGKRGKLGRLVSMFEAPFTSFPLPHPHPDWAACCLHRFGKESQRGFVVTAVQAMSLRWFDFCTCRVLQRLLSDFTDSSLTNSNFSK